MKKALILIIMSFACLASMAADPRKAVIKIIMSQPTYNLAPNDTISAIIIIDSTNIIGSYKIELRSGYQGNYSSLFEPTLQHLPGTYYKWRCIIYNDGKKLGPWYGDPLSVDGDYKFQVTLTKPGWNSSLPCAQLTESPLFYVKQIKSTVDVKGYKNDKLTPRPYPNPSSTTIHLQYHLTDPGQTGEMRIYNMQGQTIAAYTVDPASSDILFQAGDHPVGTYFYEVTQGGGKSAPQKFIISK